MCDNQVVVARLFKPSFIDFLQLKDNPLYLYLVDLQVRRLELISLVAPYRHIAWQSWMTAGVAFLWILEFTIPDTDGLPLGMLICILPFPLIGGPFLAGWNAQVMAARNYISPLDTQCTLELMLESPLTENEIVRGTLGAFCRFPFLEIFSDRYLKISAAMYFFNLTLLAGSILYAVPRFEYASDFFIVTANLLLPAFCIFIFLPALAALELLWTPFGSMRKSQDLSADGRYRGFNRSGYITYILIAIVLTLASYNMLEHPGLSLAGTMKVLLFGCPATIASIFLLCVILGKLAIGQLKQVRTIIF